MIPDRFAEIAHQFPDRLATYDFTRRLTYAELGRAANRIAQVLLAQCGADREPVVILAGVNRAATIAALGVFKADKFYVGLEPSFPLARARQIVADTQETVILAESEHLALARELAAPEHRIIELDAVPAGIDRRPKLRIDPDAIALLNYTSGSTGQPKGVVQSHRLNQGPFGIDQGGGDTTIEYTTFSGQPVRNYGLGLVGYTWEENGPSLAARAGKETLEQHVDKLSSLPFVDLLYIRCDWRDVQSRPGRLDLNPIWKLTVDAARERKLRVGFRIQLSSPNIQSRNISLPDFLKEKVPLEKVGALPKRANYLTV